MKMTFIFISAAEVGDYATDQISAWKCIPDSYRPVVIIMQACY